MFVAADNSESVEAQRLKWRVRIHPDATHAKAQLGRQRLVRLPSAPAVELRALQQYACLHMG